MANYRIKEPENKHGDLILEKSVTDAHGQQSWKEDLRMPDTTTEREDIDELEGWKTEQETVIPDGVIKGIKELENFHSGTSDNTTLAAILRTLTESLSEMIAAKYTKPYGGIPATDMSEEVNLILAKVNAINYKDVYVGAGGTVQDVMVAGNHHNDVIRGDQLSITASSAYIWVVLPNTYSPVLQMEGLNVPMTEQSNVTVGDVTYKVLKSSNSYTGTFNIILL